MRSSNSAELELASGAGAPRLARRFLASVLADWGASDDTIERSQLLASELVSNSVLHGFGNVHLRVSRVGSDGGEIRVEVRNEGVGQPTMRRAAVADLSGRGLQLVSELSAGWGSATENGQTLVWFELV